MQQGQEKEKIMMRFDHCRLMLRRQLTFLLDFFILLRPKRTNCSLQGAGDSTYLYAKCTAIQLEESLQAVLHLREIMSCVSWSNPKTTFTPLE